MNKKSTHFLIGFVLLLGILSFCLYKFNQVKKKKESVLFIGNSYTYRNRGIDQHIALLTNNDPRQSCYFSRAAQGKYHLGTHWSDPVTSEKFEQQNWDKVVLQEYSNGPITEGKHFFNFGKKWAQRIRKKNPKAKIYLYATWCYKNRPEMTDSLFQQYLLLAKKINATVIPVGTMWEKVQRKINLYDGDGAHPNRKGTFLTSCLFYEFLQNKDVRKTPHTDKRLPKWQQKKLKRLAHEFHEEYEQTTKV